MPFCGLHRGCLERLKGGIESHPDLTPTPETGFDDQVLRTVSNLLRVTALEGSGNHPSACCCPVCWFVIVGADWLAAHAAPGFSRLHAPVVLARKLLPV